MDVSEIKEQLKSAFKNFITNKVENEKWITIHPHGEESEDYRRLKLEDGESPKEAIDRVYKKEGNKEEKEFSDKVLDKVNKGSIYQNKTWREILEKRLNPDTSKSWWIEKVNKSSEDLLSDDVFSHYQLKSEEGYKTKIPSELNKYIEEKFDTTEKYITKAKQSDTKDKQSDLKGEKQETSDSPFGEGVEVIESDKKGYMLDSKNLKSYRKGDKFAIVDDWSHDDNTKRGMEKAIREHLQGGPNKETKALETKSNLEEKENTYKEVLQRYNENDRKRWSSGLSNEEYHKAWAEAEKAKKELTTARREYAESIMANFEKSDNTYYEDKQNARRERYEELSEKASRESEQAHQAFRDKMSAIPMGQPILVGHHSEKRDRRYREKAWDTLGKAVKLSDKADYYESKANSVGKAGISADDANAIAKLAQKYKSGVTSAEKRRIIDRVIDIHKNRQMAGDTSKQTDYSNLGFQVERNTDINRLQLKFDGKPEANVRSILKSNGFRWSPREGAWQRQLGGNSEGGLNRVVEQLKNINNSLLMGLDEILQQEPITTQDSKIINCINNILDPVINNSKEQDMALIEELKKLITKVENTKGEKDMEIENEKVDKRDIIRQIMAIAGKEEASEDVKTIAKLAEKLAYDKSEAGTADNKCKNEDEKDEKEVKEVKEEVKEDVENKCKNSVDNSKEDYFAKLNEIYNAASQAKEEVEYTSRADREKAAEDYFRK